MASFLPAILCTAFIMAAPAPPEPKETLAQAKALYAEGTDAVAAKDYTTAVQKFEQAYALAPDKHIFNYNIATAAELSGDCRKAKRHFQMFLDLVPEHDQRKAVVRTLEKLATTCVYDDESTSHFSAENRDARQRERDQARTNRAVQDALEYTAQAIAFYETAGLRFNSRIFGRIARAKKRQLKKLKQLTASHGFRLELQQDPIEVPTKADSACHRAAGHERKTADAYDKAIDLVDASKLVRALIRYENRARNRYEVSFENNCPK